MKGAFATLILWFALAQSLCAAPIGSNSAPALSRVAVANNSTSIFGTLNSGEAGTTFQINFYYSLTLQGGNLGAGAIYLGSTGVTTDANGNANFSAVINATLPDGAYVSATATDPNSITSVLSTPVQFLANNPVNLALAVTTSSNQVLLGDQVAFSVTVSNNGTNTASGVVLNDWLPPSLNYVYSTVTQGESQNSSNSLTWNAGAIPAGGVATLTVYALGADLGWATNWAVVSCDDFNSNYADSTNQTPVNIYVPAGPVVVSSPSNLISATLGSVLNLVVQATGIGDVKYQWRLNGAVIPGATNSTYSVLSILQPNAGLYEAVVSDNNGATFTPTSLVQLANLPLLPAVNNFLLRGLLANPLELNNLLTFLPQTFDNTTATNVPGEPLIAGVPGGKPVFFSWTAPLTGVATFNTQGSSFDTLLGVYTGASISNLTQVASDDDSGGFYTSQVKFNAVMGTTYTFIIDGAYGASGTIVFSGTLLPTLGLLPGIPQVTSQPADAIVAAGVPVMFSAAASGSGLKYQWNYNDVPIAGATTTSLLVKNVSTNNVGLYSCGVTNSTGGVLSRKATLQISMLDGSANTNVFAADKFQAITTFVNSGSLNNSVQPANTQTTPSATASPASGGGTSRGYSSTQTFSTYGGNVQQGEPNSCNNVGGASSWTYMSPPANGILNINTQGSSFTTILGVFTGNGNNFSDLTQIACNVGSSTSANNSVSFAASSNTTYYIAVDGVNGTSGTVDLNWSLSVPPTITTQPGSQTVSPGATVTLNAAANGYLPPNCQWMLNGTPIRGATNATLTITNFQFSTSGNYKMMATNSVGSATTMTASILLNSGLHLDSFFYNSTNRCCQMRLVGSGGTNYWIQASSDMKHWVTVATNNPSSGLWSFSDTGGTNQSCRFYRAVVAH